MKALAGVSIPDEFASEFVRLLHWFDEAHAGRTIMLIADAEIPFLLTSSAPPVPASLPACRRLIRAASTATPTK